LIKPSSLPPALPLRPLGPPYELDFSWKDSSLAICSNISGTLIASSASLSSLRFLVLRSAMVESEMRTISATKPAAAKTPPSKGLFSRKDFGAAVADASVGDDNDDDVGAGTTVV